MTQDEKTKSKIAFLVMVSHHILAPPYGAAPALIVHPNTANATHTATSRTFNNKFGFHKLRGCDIDIRTDEGIVKLRFIEQNPDKKDGMGNFTTYAQMARQGHKIVWVINRGIDEWIGRVQDGKWIPNQIHAYRTAQASATPNPRQAQDQYGQEYSLNDGQWINNLTNMAPGTIPDVLEQSAEVDGI